MRTSDVSRGRGPLCKCKCSDCLLSNSGKFLGSTALTVDADEGFSGAERVEAAEGAAVEVATWRGLICYTYGFCYRRICYTVGICYRLLTIGAHAKFAAYGAAGDAGAGGFTA